MPRWAKKELDGWGRVCRVSTMAARPERAAEVGQAIRESERESLIAFGSGRSYGDAALNADGRTIITRRLDRIIDLDRSRSLLVAEAGVTFADALQVSLAHGYVPAVLPGTGHATLGGGIASDVHGKNHHQVGSIGQHVAWFDLRLPDGRPVRVHPTDTRLFAATIGGMGLTGVVEKLAIRLLPVPSNAVEVRKRRIPDLDRFLEAFEIEKDRSPYVVGWIDSLARRGSLGRGILETASPSEHPVETAARKSRRVPFDFPNLALNPASVKAFNWLYFRHVSRSSSTSVMPYQRFLFPLDAVHEWNRIYGKRGFRQFQCVIPYDTGRETLRLMLERIAAVKTGSFLAVLKSMGPAGVGYLSFGMPGYTLALDFPESQGLTGFLSGLADLAADHGGRVYLAKDSTLTRDQFFRMYPQAPQYAALLDEMDPSHRMRSGLASRVGLRGRTHG